MAETSNYDPKWSTLEDKWNVVKDALAEHDMNAVELAPFLKFSHTTVRKWMKRFLELYPEELKMVTIYRQTGRPRICYHLNTFTKV